MSPLLCCQPLLLCVSTICLLTKFTVNCPQNAEFYVFGTLYTAYTHLTHCVYFFYLDVWHQSHILVLYTKFLFSTEILSLMCCSNFHINPPTQFSPHICHRVPSPHTHVKRGVLQCPWRANTFWLWRTKIGKGVPKSRGLH